jgi:hypothetical protein
MVPTIPPRVEQPLFDLSCFIKTSQMIALAEIARSAGQCPVGFVVCALLPRWHNVFNLEWKIENGLGVHDNIRTDDRRDGPRKDSGGS